ncbi:hypothetical protein SCHPADRAFT_911912 [Schizopora paradoxa]|uniref:Uncharacterized protein n=1 Tax=Schizopora paradoxa TaxID=27342 RepID=A0A0H2QYH5_9AGAM|nr:hypothetical protein SCHPADRAFT_911912 [Schizopora paradoxa]
MSHAGRSPRYKDCYVSTRAPQLSSTHSPLLSSSLSRSSPRSLVFPPPPPCSRSRLSFHKMLSLHNLSSK